MGAASAGLATSRTHGGGGVQRQSQVVGPRQREKQKTSSSFAGLPREPLDQGISQHS